MEAGLTENSTLRSIKNWLWKGDEGSISGADAFARLYEETHLIVFRYVFGLSGGPVQDAEDLTVETYERAWKTRHRFPAGKNPSLGWLLRIARNLAIDLSRRRRVRNFDENIHLELLVDPNLLPEMDVMTREQITILWHMLDTLVEDVREMVVLRYLLGWQVRQIAIHLGLNENTVTVTIKRALKSLRRDWPRSQEQENE
jgi:RNA polymerase sigma-70 factor, ECF subfamily